jgi:hypothetical protein
LVACFLTFSAAAFSQDTPPATADASQQRTIEVENWTRPQSGWLYVLDPKPDSGSGGRV